MSECFSAIVGNDALCRRLASELRGDTLSHAYILEGPRGSGKHTLAKEIAMALACRERTGNRPIPCGECPACRKIRAGYSPDVITLSRPADRAFLPVDAIRDLRRSLNVVPNDLPFKVYIIADAHTMNAQAQNAFLLTLEEPPPFVLFLLLTENAGLLLETIRSRAPVLRLAPVSEQETADFLRFRCEDRQLRAAAERLAREHPDEFAAILRLSDGCIGKAEELLDEKTRAPLLERRRCVTDVAAALCAGGDGDRVLLTLFERFDNRDEATAFTLMLENALCDLVRLSRSENAPITFFTDQEAATEWAEKIPLARLLAMQKEVGKTLLALSESANLRLSAAQLFAKLYTV